MADRQDNGSFSRVGGAVLIGAAIGAVVALLFAPRSGAETREELRRVYARSRATLADVEDEVVDRIAGLADQVRTRVDELLANGKTMAEERRKDLQDAIAVAKKALEEERAILRRLRRRRASDES